MSSIIPEKPHLHVVVTATPAEEPPAGVLMDGPKTAWCPLELAILVASSTMSKVLMSSCKHIASGWYRLTS